MGGSCVWKDEYSVTYPGIVRAKNRRTDHCRCTVCDKDISIRYKGRKDIETHLGSHDHKRKSNDIAGVQPLTDHFKGKSHKLQSMRPLF